MPTATYSSVSCLRLQPCPSNALHHRLTRQAQMSSRPEPRALAAHPHCGWSVPSSPLGSQHTLTGTGASPQAAAVLRCPHRNKQVPGEKVGGLEQPSQSKAGGTAKSLRSENGFIKPPKPTRFKTRITQLPLMVLFPNSDHITCKIEPFLSPKSTRGDPVPSLYSRSPFFRDLGLSSGSPGLCPSAPVQCGSLDGQCWPRCNSGVL